MAGSTDDSGPGPDDPAEADPGPDADRPADAGPVSDPDEAAWRAIVEHYGERAQIDAAAPPAKPDDRADQADDGQDGPAPGDPARLRRLFEPLDRSFEADRIAPGQDAGTAGVDDAGSDLARSSDAPFVAPVPPVTPRAPADRRAAWFGVIGGPALLLLALLLGIDLPSVLALGCVTAFVVGFVYLVVRMPREPRDPGDDGARV